jgi:hypothetical protein
MNFQDLKTLFNVIGSNIIYRKTARSFHWDGIHGWGLPPSLKPPIIYKHLGQSERGDGFVRKISGGKTS